jgi:hypothetical protein
MLHFSKPTSAKPCKLKIIGIQSPVARNKEPSTTLVSQFPKPTCATGFKINVQGHPLATDESPIMLVSGTSPNPPLLTTGENHSLSRSKVQPFTLCSTEVTTSTGPGSARFKKRKWWVQGAHKEQKSNMPLFEGEQQVGDLPKKLRPNDHCNLKKKVRTRAPIQKLRSFFPFRKKYNIDRIEINQDFFSVLNWKFVKLNPDPDVLNEKNSASNKMLNENIIFRFLNQFNLNHFQNPANNPLEYGVRNYGEDFQVPRITAAKFFEAYHAKRGHFPYSSELNSSERNFVFQEIMLEIYNMNFPFEEHMEFLDELQNHAGCTPKRIEFIKRIMKTSTISSILYLSFFGEHEGPTLKGKHILEFMGCIKLFLKGLAEIKNLAPTVTDKFTTDWHYILHSLENRGLTSRASELSLSWRTVDYWIGCKIKALNISIPPETRCNKTLVEIIHKILFFSNRKEIYKKYDICTP